MKTLRQVGHDMVPVKRITLRDLLNEPERFKAELGQPFVGMLLDHKSNWMPGSRGGEPNCREEYEAAH